MSCIQSFSYKTNLLSLNSLFLSVCVKDLSLCVRESPVHSAFFLNEGLSTFGVQRMGNAIKCYKIQGKT